MPTPESWYRLAERVLERERAGLSRFEAEYGAKRPETAENADIPPETPGFGIGGLYGPGSPDSDGVIHDVQLFEVSLVRNPLNPHARVIRAKGADDDWSDDKMVKL